MNYYTGNIKWAQDVVFVFGSNPEGRHGAGAAKVARQHFGARYGQGEGLQGNAYALPTKDLRIKGSRTISAKDITESIRRLYECAREHPDRRFMIAYRNTYERSLNGYTGLEMIRMFLDAGPIPENIHVSQEWYDTGMFDRPRAQYWYLSPFNGDRRCFDTLDEARRSARTEHGFSTIYQTGPGTTNKVIETVRGYDPLP